MSKAQSRVGRAGEDKKQKKVKIVVDKGAMKLIKYSWFPLTALILFSIGLYIGVYFILDDSKAFFSGEMWARFFEALRNF